MARTQGHGNPKWTRDEIVLALDLYFRCSGRIPSSNDSRVVELSALLRTLPYHREASKRPSFRNSDGVVFKLQNLRQVATGNGLGNVSSTDRIVWKEFGSNPQKTEDAATLIRDGLKMCEEDPPDDEEFPEGRVLTRLHKSRERNRRIRGKLIAARRRKGSLCCEMCAYQSPLADKELEDASFEAHHVVPISLSVRRNIKVSDMALLCANCHRLLHRMIALRGWLGVEDGRRRLTTV
jgi:5-methylcytosine-specific restriction protein A